MAGAGVEALPSSSCTAVEYEGRGDPDVLIASDFPLQGSSRTQTIQIVEAIRYLLEQSNFKAGDHNVAFQSCDDATAQAGKVGLGQVLDERAGLRRQQGRRRRDRLRSTRAAPRSRSRC